ncbi:MAG TPA: hypothetical protein VLK22_01665 [Candidatus Udaeobacter sp.]|nr:hypothetical protein [Candidatus Udaeobacter sp.]
MSEFPKPEEFINVTNPKTGKPEQFPKKEVKKLEPGMARGFDIISGMPFSNRTTARPGLDNIERGQNQDNDSDNNQG